MCIEKMKGGKYLEKKKKKRKKKKGEKKNEAPASITITIVTTALAGPTLTLNVIH